MSEAFRCEAISNHCDCLIPHMSGKPLTTKRNIMTHRLKFQLTSLPAAVAVAGKFRIDVNIL